ncbi:hypothetical protein B0H10DRAFT_1649681, partial [Mycena sp. CBHHK59/15]
ASLLPKVTEDHNPEGFFTQKWNEDDMGRLNDRLCKHSMDSSSGEDQTMYSELLEILNDDLAFLCNEYSYRLMVLESCFLKAIMILIHWHIFDWAEARGLILPAQTGFRPGYRTNNNPFILRCLKEWARAHGTIDKISKWYLTHSFTFYVACVDFMNAFLSTDQPTLWLKLFRLGMGGKIFD